MIKHNLKVKGVTGRKGKYYFDMGREIFRLDFVKLMD